MVRPSLRRAIAKAYVSKGRLNIRTACHAFMISETCYRYSAKLSDENSQIVLFLVAVVRFAHYPGHPRHNWLELLTKRNRNWGFKLCFLYLRNVKGYKWNHKRVYRIYRELELNLRIKPKNLSLQ